jgi:hypothetical protein
MTEQEFDQLMKQTKRDLVKEIWRLQNRVAELEKHNTDMGWRLNPDRMGGQFSEWETNRRGDEWS